MLPGTDGLTLCRRFAVFRHPIVMVTAKIEEIDRLLGLEAPMIISVSLTARAKSWPAKTIFAPRCKPQRELQQQDAGPLMIDESRFQVSGVVKRWI